MLRLIQKKRRNAWKQTKPMVWSNPNRPTSRKMQEHEDPGHAVHPSWCLACVPVRGKAGQHRSGKFAEEEREDDAIVASDLEVCQRTKYEITSRGGDKKLALELKLSLGDHSKVITGPMVAVRR